MIHFIIEVLAATILFTSSLTIFIILLETTLNAPGDLKKIPRLPLWFILFIAFFPLQPRDRLALIEKQVGEEKLKKSPIPGAVVIWFLGRWILEVADCESVSQILSNPDAYPKLLPDQISEHSFQNLILGRSIVLSNGDEWRRQRRIANFAFKRNWDAEAIGQKLKTTFRVLEKKDLNRVNTHQWTTNLTLDVFGTLIFGWEFNSIEEQASEVVKYYHKVMSYIGSCPYIFIFPFTYNLDFLPFIRRVKKDVANFDDALNAFIQKKKRGSSSMDKDKDLLDALIEASEDGKGLVGREFRNNLFIYLLAGHDTTANAIACAVYFLSKYPDIQGKARAEVKEVLGDSNFNDKEYIPTSDELKSMKYLLCVIKETMRIYPSVPLIPMRRLDQDTKIHPDVIIPSKTLIAMNVWKLHRGTYWDSPEEFRPERFLTGNETLYQIENNCSFNYIPFGGGQRICIGLRFSVLEQLQALSMVLKTYSLSLPRDSIHFDNVQFKPRTNLLLPLEIEIKMQLL